MMRSKASLLPYHCPRCGKGQAFSSMDSLLLHLQTHHHQMTDHSMPWKSNPSPTPYAMLSLAPRHSSSTALSPNAQELGRQIALARQLTQKQRQAEFRASSLLKDRPVLRPSAHITPRRKELSDDDTGAEDVSLKRSGVLSGRTSHVHSRSVHQSIGSTTSRSHLDPAALLRESATKKGMDQTAQDELISKWKNQREIQRLESRLHDKTREVADLRTKVDHSVRIAQEKERRIAEIRSFLHDTALKQSAAKEKLRRYVDSLADRAERAESEVEDLRSSLSPPKTDTSTRSDPRSTGQSMLSTYPRANYSHLSVAEDQVHGDQGNFVKYSQMSFAEGGPYFESLLSTAPTPNELNTASSIPELGVLERKVNAGYSQEELSSFHSINNNRDISPTDHIPYGSLRPGNYDRLSSLLPKEVIEANPTLPTNEALYVPSPAQAYESTYLEVNKASGHADDHSGVFTSNAPVTSSSVPVSFSSLGNGNPAGDYKDPSDWGDMDFLEDVMEDVLARRQEREKQEVGEEEGDSPYLMPTSTRGDTVPHNNQIYRYQGGSRSELYGVPPHHSDGEGEDSASDVSVTSESQWSEEGRNERRVDLGKSLHVMEPDRRKAALFLVFSYLHTSSLLNCATVCREWREISREPDLWQYVRLHDRRMSSKFLQTISKWCTQLKWLIVERLSPRERRRDEVQDVYQKKIRGSLEPGMEELLLSAGKELLTLKIVDCPHIITERVLWLTSCHSRSLRSLTYISSSDPVGPEVLWALGAGCRQIKSLKIPPRHPCDRPKKFNSSCIRMISRCWNQLQALSVGGSHVKPESLAFVAKSCPKLQVLELDHMIKITEERAVPLCRSGLRGLHTLILRHTPITPSAVIHFHGACPQLTRISVHLSVSDFFPAPASPGQRKEFSRAIETLLDVSRKRALEAVLEIRADYK